MSQEIIKFDVNIGMSENSRDFKEEFQVIHYPDNKICVFETSININKTEYMRNDKIRNYETFSVDHIKTDLPSSEVDNSISNNVKVEDEICRSHIQNKFDNQPLSCNHCHEVYQDYCTKCRVLVHILNKRPCDNTHSQVRELPKYILETRELIGHLGIFSLKVIPEDVRFGPFTGLNSTGLPLRIKAGRFVVGDDKLELLNWMQYINPARNIYEQNLIPFQYEDKLYYYSTRRIQKGEELLVYFGEKYKDNLLETMEIEFVPITKQGVENVFACTFCCLGFSSKEYLAEHKAVYHSETSEMFAVKELAQCLFCKIYLEEKEYLEYHMDYCRETNARYCVFPSREVHKRAVDTRSSLRSKGKKGKRIYKCTHCKFRTMYNADFRRHTNEHCEVKMYKCRICDRRYNTQESLRAHVETIHADKVNIKNIKETSPHSDDVEKQCQSSKCVFQIRDKCPLKSLLKIKHLNRSKYKCANCEFKTYYKSHLVQHVKTKHLQEYNYKCIECEYKTSRKSDLERHINAKHLKLKDYKCEECEYKANRKSHLERHMKTKHLKLRNYKWMKCENQTNFKSNLELHTNSKPLKLRDYKCAMCEYKSNYKSSLELHIKSKHLKLRDYKCSKCEYQTNFKSSLKLHVKTKHLKICDYKCMNCIYQTNLKANLERHIKTSHLNLRDFKCMECEYKANRMSHLEIHMKAKHLNLRDYKCTECDYKANRKSHLESHMKARHRKLRDYKCTECDYKANRKPNLERHVKIKHLKLNDYKCLECEYQTNCKSGLERHVKTKHLKLSDYKCMECEYQTNVKSNLERHVKTKHI